MKEFLLLLSLLCLVIYIQTTIRHTVDRIVACLNHRNYIDDLSIFRTATLFVAVLLFWCSYILN